MVLVHSLLALWFLGTILGATASPALVLHRQLNKDEVQSQHLPQKRDIAQTGMTFSPSINWEILDEDVHSLFNELSANKSPSAVPTSRPVTSISQSTISASTSSRLSSQQPTLLSTSQTSTLLIASSRSTPSAPLTSTSSLSFSRPVSTTQLTTTSHSTPIAPSSTKPTSQLSTTRPTTTSSTSISSPTATSSIQRPIFAIYTDQSANGFPSSQQIFVSQIWHNLNLSKIFQ